MTIRRLFLIIVCFAIFGTLRSQDIHYTLFNLAPLKLNPAQTGAFYGSVRIGGIFRDQWYSIIDNEYKSPSFYGDAPIVRGFRDQDWVGVGLQFVNDRVGLGDLRTSGMLISGAYHFALDKKQTKVFTFGIQGGSISRRLDLTSRDGLTGFSAGDALQLGLENQNAVSTDPLLNTAGGDPSPGRNNNGDLNTSYFDLNAGVMFKATDPKAGTRLELGLAAGHLLTPNEAFGAGRNTGGPNNPGNNNDDNDANRPMSLVLHGLYEYPINDKISIEPSFLFQTTGGGKNNIVLQGLGGYMINPQVKLQGGLGYRVGDSAQLLFGAVLDESLRVGVSYDINISQLSGLSNYQGGFEIGASYIFKIYKQPDIVPSILCPRL